MVTYYGLSTHGSGLIDHSPYHNNVQGFANALNNCRAGWDLPGDKLPGFKCPPPPGY